MLNWDLAKGSLRSQQKKSQPRLDTLEFWIKQLRVCNQNILQLQIGPKRHEQHEIAQQTNLDQRGARSSSSRVDLRFVTDLATIIAPKRLAAN
jgi:hypothetical protein